MFLTIKHSELFRKILLMASSLFNLQASTTKRKILALICRRKGKKVFTVSESQDKIYD